MARKTINQWVEERTNKKIKDLLPPTSVSKYTRLVVTNAVYFHGNWEKQFKEQATREAPFYLVGGRETKVPMMHQRGHFRLGAADGIQLLEMPYTGSRLSMVILLPDHRDGLTELEESLSAGKIEGWLNRLQNRDVDVSMPKFKLTYQFDLAAMLEALGTILPFTKRG